MPEFEFFSFVAVLIVLSTCFFIVKIELDAVSRSVERLKETVETSLKQRQKESSKDSKGYMADYMNKLEFLYPPIDLTPVAKKKTASAYKAKTSKAKSKKGKSNG
jgi:hypothetical protein